MPQETPRGIRTGILWAVMLMLNTWTVTAAGQGVGPATVTVQVDLDAETQRLLTEAEALIGRGRNDDAFGMLSAREFELAGNPVYDYRAYQGVLWRHEQDYEYDERREQVHERPGAKYY